MEGKAAWQPIAMGGADFNEIWDDTELIKVFSKSINYYKKMHDPNRKEEETPMPEVEGEEEYTDGARMDESETQTVEAMAVSSSAPTTPAHKEGTPKKTPVKRKSSAARKRIVDDEGEEAAADETATQSAVAPGALDKGEHAAAVQAAYAGYDYSGYGGYYPHPQYPGAYAAASPAAPSPKKTQRKKKDATQAAVSPAYDPAYAACYPPAYPQGPYGASYPYGAPSGYPMMSPAYPPMPTTPHYHLHPVPHTHAPHHHHHHGHHHHQPPPPPPPPAGLDDEELKSLLNAWYYSGYYAGRYQAMRDATPK